MRTNPFQLKASLKAQTVCLVSGDEPFLADISIKEIKKHAENHNHDDFKQIIIETPAPSFDELKIHTHNLGLFDNKKICLIRLNTIINKKASDELLTILQTSTDCFFIIHVTKKPTKAQERQPLFKWVEQQGLWVQANHLKDYEREKWLRSYFNSKKLSTSNEGYQYILDCTFGNLSACAEEVDKLSLTFKQGIIPTRELKESLSNHAQYTIFECVDKAIQQKPKDALFILNKLQLCKEEPAVLMWALIKEIRTLAAIQHDLRENITLTKLWKKYNVWQKKQLAYKNLLNSNNISFFLGLLKEAQLIDQQLKGLNSTPAWPNIKVYVFKLATAVKNVNLNQVS